MKRLKVAIATALAGSATLGFVTGAAAQSVADFYKGKNVELYIGYSVGGGYDVYARLLARYMGRHIPGNPTVVPKNMEGAGSLRLTNWLYNAGLKDGSMFGTVARGAAFDPLLVKAPVAFDAKKFNWLGSMNDEVSVCVSWADSGIEKFEDLYTKELVIGGTGASADTDQFPRLLNSILGTKFKIVTGYPGGNDVSLAMQRGEVKGRCGWSWSSVISTQPAWLKEKKINILVQLSLSKHPDLPNVPQVIDLAKTDEQRQIFKMIFARQTMGRPFLAPPNVPADRVAALRKAFMDTVTDPDLIAEANKEKLEINPVSGEAIQKLVEEVYSYPKAVADKAAAALQ